MSKIKGFLFAVAAFAFTASAFSQDADTAFVPFSVNVDARATARLGGVAKFDTLLRAGSIDTLIIYEETTPALARPGMTPNPAAMRISRGKISLELSRAFGSTDIALYSLNGKRLLHGKAAASEAFKSISHHDIKTGVYLLSVKGAGGNAFTTRFAHGGGGLNIDVAFSSGNSGSVPEKTIPGSWIITVSAPGYLDTTLFAFVPETGRGSIPVQNITLLKECVDEPYNPSTEFCQVGTNVVKDLCGTETYTAAQFCQEGTDAVKDLCGGTETYASTEFCQDGTNEIKDLCGTETYTAAQFCQDGTDAVKDLCGGTETFTADEFCQEQTNLVKDLCGGTETFTADEFCQGGTVKELHVSCSVASDGYEGTAISRPVISCNDSSVPFGTVLSGLPDEPNWDNPAPGNYAVYAEADCGHGVFPATFCGILIVHEVTLSCGSMPASGYSGFPITPPDLTCSHGIRGTPNWTNAPNWSNPAYGPYNVSATATCGLVEKTAGCGPLNILCSGNDNTETHYCSAGIIKTYGVLNDTRSPSKTYKTVEIGNQIWTAENLNYSASSSRCGNKNTGSLTTNDADCATYGRLYGTSALGSVCPAGWRLPNDADWTALRDFVNSENGCSDDEPEPPPMPPPPPPCSGTKLKTASGWNTGGHIPGTDNYGFSALPGGYGNSGSDFFNFGNEGNWWSSTTSNGINYSYWRMRNDYNGMSKSNGSSFLYSVRCVKN